MRLIIWVGCYVLQLFPGSRRDAQLAIAELRMMRTFYAMPDGPEKEELARFITTCTWFQRAADRAGQRAS